MSWSRDSHGGDISKHNLMGRDHLGDLGVRVRVCENSKGTA